jgi:YbbR domain-containing protein
MTTPNVSGERGPEEQSDDALLEELQMGGRAQSGAQRRSRPLRIRRTDLGLMLAAIGLALVIWLVAINEENPLITQELQGSVPVTVLGLGENLAIVEDLTDEAVRLRLRAPRSSWQGLDPTDFRATLDLTGLGAGESTVPVRVVSRDPQVTILDIQLPQITVSLDPLVSKEAPIQADIMDGTAFGYDWQPAILEPMTVTVSGPDSLVQQVSRARAEIYLRGAKSQVERNETVTAVDAQNRPVAGVRVEPNLTHLLVPVEQWPGRKEVAVRVKLAGRPADGYRLNSVKVEPSTVVLLGDSDALSQVPGYVETETLSLAGASSDVRQRLALILPAGITSFDGDNVIASAGITAIEDGVTITQPLVQQGLGPGLIADSALREVDVILSGPVKALSALNQDDIFVILDLTNLISGTHIVKPRVVLPGEFTLEGVIPETVEVVIRQQTGSEAPDELALPTLPLNSDITPTSPVTAGVIVAVTASSVISPLTNMLEISPAQSGGQAP